MGGQVRCWEIQANGSSVPKAMQAHEQPVLCSAWNADGSTVYSGGCDNTVKAWNLATNQQQVMAAGIRRLANAVQDPEHSQTLQLSLVV